MSSSQAKPQPREIRKNYYVNGDVDFDELARHDPEFAAISHTGKEKRWINFQNPTVVKQLTLSLLKFDFNLTLRLPDDRLCPPIPVRWNYVRWIQELLDTTNPTSTPFLDESIDKPVIGLDIGVGASCIYGLLACASRPSWRMKGTDVDFHSSTFASANVVTNKLQDRIFVTRSESPEGPLISLSNNEQLDFVMTNPPFFDSRADMEASYTNKSAPPAAACTGSTNEMICPGGDLGFVKRILAESLVLRERVRWYTAMFGKWSSLQAFMEELKNHGIENRLVAPLHAGQRTERWAVAWSFSGWRPRHDLGRHPEVARAFRSPSTDSSIEIPFISLEQLGQEVDEFMRGLEVKWDWDEESSTGLMEAQGNAWGRAARRKKKSQQPDLVDNDDATGERAPKRMRLDDTTEKAVRSTIAHNPLTVRVVCKQRFVEIGLHGFVEVRWLRGEDHVLFQSFCGAMKNTLVKTQKQKTV